VQNTSGDIEDKREFFDLHLLVTNRMKAFGDTKLAREACNGVLVDAEPMARGLGQARRGCLQEAPDARQGDETEQRPQPAATEHLGPAGEDRKAGILLSLEMKDSLDSKNRLEIQRQDQAARVAGTQRTQASLRGCVQMPRLVQEQERAAVERRA
jgi:hypothetical protein